jgi:hypothetical protein
MLVLGAELALGWCGGGGGGGGYGDGDGDGVVVVVASRVAGSCCICPAWTLSWA